LKASFNYAKIFIGKIEYRLFDGNFKVYFRITKKKIGFMSIWDIRQWLRLMQKLLFQTY